MYGAFSKPFHVSTTHHLVVPSHSPDRAVLLSVHFNFWCLCICHCCCCRFCCCFYYDGRSVGLYIYPQKTCLLLQRKKHLPCEHWFQIDAHACGASVFTFFVYLSHCVVRAVDTHYTFLCSKYTNTHMHRHTLVRYVLVCSFTQHA